MNMHIAEIVDELHELGVEDIVLSPGARSTPLAILFCEHTFNIYMDVDERSAAFFALGIAKAKNKAVVLVCTSGSACGHYLPAAIEAKHSRVPLIILTADRPAELQNVGAPQTINQNNMFANFVKYYEELSLDTFNKNSRGTSYPRLVMQKAYGQAQAKPCGVVHINVPLREPLVPQMEKLDFSTGRNKKTFAILEGEKENRAFVDYFINNCLGKKGIIVCGPDTIQAEQSYYTDFIKLSSILNLPLLADPLSQFRAYAHENIITNYTAFLKSNTLAKSLEADYIILIGQSPVSKNFFNFLEQHQNAEIFQIDEDVEYRNPALNTTKIVQISAWAFAKAIIGNKNIPNTNHSQEYLAKWQEAQNAMAQKLALASESQVLFEGKIIQTIQKITAAYTEKHSSETVHMVLANSMSIRHMDLFWQAKKQSIEFYGNRGANGIDGTISFALGIAASAKSTETAEKTSNPTVLITGDLAFFHDITGLLVGTKHDLHLTIVLLNNNGGGIFQHLPQAKVKNFEYLFLTPHDVQFSALAKLYGIAHYAVENYTAFDSVFSSALSTKGIKVIEICIDMPASKELYDHYQQVP